MEYVYTIFLSSYQSKSISFSPSSPSFSPLFSPSPSPSPPSLSFLSLSPPPSPSLLLSLTELGCPSFSLFSRSTETVKGVLAYYNTIKNTQDTTTRPLNCYQPSGKCDHVCTQTYKCTVLHVQGLSSHSLP